MAEEPSLAPQWLKSGITAAGTSNTRTEEGLDIGGRPAALPSPRIAEGPGRDIFTGRRSSDWSGKASQVSGPSNQSSWEKPTLRAHHRGGAHRNIFEDNTGDIFGPSTGGPGKQSHSQLHHHRGGPSNPSSPYRPGKDASKEPLRDYGGAWSGDSHQNQAGPRLSAPRERLNARGPSLNGLGPDGKGASRGQRHPQGGLDKEFLPVPRAGPAHQGLRDLQQPASPGGPPPIEAVYTRLADTSGSPSRPFSPQPVSPLPLSPTGPGRLQSRATQPALSPAPAAAAAAAPAQSPRPQRTSGDRSPFGSSLLAPDPHPSRRGSPAGVPKGAEPAVAAAPATPQTASPAAPAAASAAPRSAASSTPVVLGPKPSAEAPIPQRHGGWGPAAHAAAQEKASAVQKEPSASQATAPARSSSGVKGWAGLAASAAGAAPAGAAAGSALPGASSGPTPTPAASSVPPAATRMADAISQQQVTSAAAMQQVATERQREEQRLARQAKLIPVAFSGPRPRQAGTGHLGDRGQIAKAPAMTALTPPTSSKAMLGAPRGAGAAEGRSVAPVAIGARRNTAPEDAHVSSGPTPLTLSHSLPGGEKLGSNGHSGSLARAASDLERNTRQALLSPTKSAAPQNGISFAPAAVKPPGTPTGLQNKAKERNSFFQSLRRSRTTNASERPSSSSSLSPASSLDAPSLAASGRAETGDAAGLTSLSEVVQEQLAGVHLAQNGFHFTAAMPVLNGQHGSSPEETALQEVEGFTAEEIAWMRSMGWTPGPASSSDAGCLTEEEIRSFKEQQHIRQSKASTRSLKPTLAAATKTRPRSVPYPCPPLSPWRTANGNHHLATLDVGSYGSKLSDSDSEAE